MRTSCLFASTVKYSKKYHSSTHTMPYSYECSSLIVVTLLLSAKLSWSFASGPRGEASRQRVGRDGKPRTRPRPKSRERRPRVDSVWDPKHLVSRQDANHDAPAYDLSTSSLKLASETEDTIEFTHNLRSEVATPCFRFMSLDELSPGLSEKFCSDSSFRNNLRDSIRKDVFNDTPLYEGLSDKARIMLQAPDSSLQGSWKSKKTPLTDCLLSDAFGEDAPTGTELLNQIGQLCGGRASYHWIDIVGVQDRSIRHSWHQDTGRDSFTVLWGFPPESNYNGTGVFTHMLRLKESHFAPEGHAPHQPLLFQGEIPEKYIIRPNFSPGNELLVYRDVDALHSAPDVTYRSSVMRFM